MNNFFSRYALLCIATLLLFVVSVSCSGSDGDGDSADYVSVTPHSELYLEPDASATTLYVESSGNWTVSGIPAWLKVIPASGKSGDKLVIEVEDNASIDERYTVLTVTCGTATATIKVTQYGNLETDYVNVGFDTPGVTYTYSASDGNLSITYNGADKPAVAAGSAIVLPAEYGYDIRVVESCSYSGNTLNMSTKEGNMCNLFRNIDFTLSTNPTATRSAAGERVFTPVSYGYRDEQGVYHELYNRNTRASYTSSESLWSFTGNFNGERIYNGAAGTLYWEQCQFDAGLDATLKFDFGEKEITPEHIEGDLQSFSYTITGNVGIDMLLHYNCEASYSEGDDRIIRKDIVRPKEILFQVGHVPVLVTVSTHLGKSHSFEAKGSIDATTGVKCSNEISVGLAWSKGGGVTEITPTSTSQFSVYPPTLEAEASVEAKVSYYPQIELKLYKFIGPWVEPRPYLSDKLEAGLRASADGKNHIGWTSTLAGGIDLRFGINLGFGILDIIEVEKELWSSKIYNLVERNFFNAPVRITKLSPADGEEVKEGESVTAEFLVESYCPLTGGYYPCPLALVGFEAECGELEYEMLATDAQGKVKVEWIPDPKEENSSNAATRAAELVERTLTASILDSAGESIDEAELMVKVEEANACNDANHVHAVDLGLSVKWACCNVGATKPEEYGGYYAWGETEEKSDYDWDTYKWCNGTYYSLTKYCIVDNKTVLDPEDDVAHVKWGGSWRMPTLEEQKELIDECSWEWTKLNGVNGCRVTGPNGNSIFLPAAGVRDGTELISRVTCGCYWSSSLNGNGYAAYRLFVNNIDIQGMIRGMGYYDRYIGYSVRPVCE